MMTEFHQAMLVAGVWMIVSALCRLRDDDLWADFVGFAASLAAAGTLLNQILS